MIRDTYSCCRKIEWDSCWNCFPWLSFVSFDNGLAIVGDSEVMQLMRGSGAGGSGIDGS